ncbi:DUF418 domain-containing protein [Sphingomonas bacterium]|uniref:DUF418 domain-containing protein n=1 Tax=Sphingomonas bacterium TaxID=1895847 RepID=UPI0026057A17|nr:DUF418 domain-containing protein [Sphingomonas bacterium]MDB5679968.1 hypothetical protein [Sphingomonas bacterium]
MTATAPRLRTLDAVRGVAVMGIFLLNVIDMAMPGYAYVDPHYYGGASGANWWEWAIAYVVADGKFRGLFTMMFGASTVLIAERAMAGGERPAVIHYARMVTLFVFGMIHAYLIWSGDILVLYSICGAVAFLAWRWRPKLLLEIGIVLLAFKLVNGMTAYYEVSTLKAAAERAYQPDVAPWQAFQRDASPPLEAIPGELAGFRGTYSEALRTRVPTTIFMQTVISREAWLDTIGLMLVGMALFRLGFFSGAWSRRSYWLAAAPIPVLWLAYIPLVLWLERTANAPLTQIATEAIQLTLLRPFLSLGYAALVILFVQSRYARWLADRLAATGRMAFSNYLGTSIMVTLFFNGYGLGWYGYLQRWQCLIVVAVVWLAMVAWSKPWLDRFAYGPFEWLWRSVARARLQPFHAPK